jgi:HTH-type transcriptional regulator/antitoxin MqsA
MFLGPEEGDRVSKVMAAFSRTVNMESGQFLRRVRKKLRLGQKEAGEIFGGGVNAFSRYETGKTPPPVPLVKLLRILDEHPDLLPLAR